MSGSSRAGLVALVTVLGIGLISACEAPQVVIPPGAQVVRVTVDGEEVRVDPASVRPGDVYFVIEGPDPGFMLVRRRPAAGAEPTGMSPADIRRVERGDFQGTQMDDFSVTCGLDEWTEERHWEGCRENARLALTQGLYAILGAEGEEPGVPPAMDVLEVAPGQ